LDPVDYAAVYSWPHNLSAEHVDKVWRDPTMPSAYESLCNIFNHEWQKHGYCLGYWDENTTNNNTTVQAAKYFEFTIRAATLLEGASAQLNAWARDHKVAQPTASEIRSLYSRRISLWCSGGGMTLNRFLAVRTCWNVSRTEWAPLEPIDCAPESPYGSFDVCDERKPVLLDKYVAGAAAVAENGDEFRTTDTMSSAVRAPRGSSDVT